MNRIHNFYAGPGALPESVLKQINKDLFSFESTGVSVMELSHRSAPIVDLIDDTVEGFRSVLGLNDEWELILLQGGGSLQFAMTAMNLSKIGDKIDYLDTGYWSQRAIEEAKRTERDVCVVASGEGYDFNRLPRGDEIMSRDGARYLHLCTNNTVVGTQWHQLPDSDTPLVLDASSDFLSRRIPLENVNCLYAHAQKNVGLAGVTVVAVRKASLIKNNIPYILDYHSHIEMKSNYHTPPVFSIYVTNLMLKWLNDEIGGLDSIIEINNIKAEKLYQAIDDSSLFSCPVDLEDRSEMNVVFTTGNSLTDTAFEQHCSKKGLIGVKGHRSRGGLRASLYNAVTIENVEALINEMKVFERT